jgi:hypothetical protein
MRRVAAKTAFLSATLILIGPSAALPRTELHFASPEIPSRYNIGSAYIFTGSDSVYINERLLDRGEDYRFVPGEGVFDFSRISAGPGDTLHVVFAALPDWIRPSYGRALPEPGSSSQSVPIATTRPVLGEPQTTLGSNLTLSGAKSFRFSARTAGNAEFSQSLDLAISGEVAEGVKVTGSISDRGYNPAYGTANSRLNELDKVNLRLESRNVLGQVGDITIAGPRERSRGKAVSGVSFELDYPYWHAEGTAARPQGIFETFRTSGRDGFQGPYQIQTRGRGQPVVPGSETVWLDGEKLERGANKDYTIDYPTGRITFDVNHPIDLRSRIDVDYEPQTEVYKQELFSLGGGGQAADSSVFFSLGIIREGDDKNQLQTGEFSDRDKRLLREAGDSSATRSGVTADSNGAYTLVIDSLPDSVFQFVGDGNGDFAVNFSFVGAGKGAYRFLGNDRYDFVGDGNGDYLPIVILPRAERTRYVTSMFGLQNRLVGRASFDFRMSEHDRNLWSNFDDEDNEAFFYRAELNRNWLWQGAENGISAGYRVREAQYNPRERINRPDFERDFFLPDGFVATTDERLADVKLRMSPGSRAGLNADLALLDYQDKFHSRVGGVEMALRPWRTVRLATGWRGINSDLRDTARDMGGSVITYDASARWDPLSLLRLLAAYQRDRRENDYFDERRGTRYDRIRLEAGSKTERIQYEYFSEDSLTNAWMRVLNRNRLLVSSVRRLRDFNYDATVSYQWLDRIESDENSFLGRLILSYANPLDRLSVSTAYTISDEQRNARGITYLEVEPGQGDYILEDGEYIPDPDGNFIQVEELLSSSARVRRGEKSFRLRKDWRVLLVQFDSNIDEELLEEGERSLLWVLPFYSDEEEPYQFYSRRYDSDIRAVPIRGFYGFNLRLSQDLQKRDVAGSLRRRRNTTGTATLKQAVGETYLEESIGFFDIDRDELFAASGEVDGYRARLSVRQIVGDGDVSAGGLYRRAESEAGEISHQYGVTAGSRLAVLGKGELRLSSEWYRQVFENLAGIPSFQLTDNRSGERGMSWSLAFRYSVRSGVRVNASVSGRHADNRTARIFARGEMVAGF